MSSSMNPNQDSKSFSSSFDFPKLLSTLPTHYNHDDDAAHFYQYQGYWYMRYMLEGVVSLQKQFQALPTDIFICGAPKTGNTWLKSLCYAIATRDPQQTGKNPLTRNLSHSLVPLLELEYPENPIIGNSRNQRPMLLSTHVPYTSLPESITSLGCKIIYICRDPKDTFVSLFHFNKRIELAGGPRKSKKNLALVDSVHLFCEGKINHGPYWEHVLGFHEAGLDRPDKFLFLKYEKLKIDMASNVKRLAAFMDLPFSNDEEVEGVQEKIVEMCSFRNLSGLEVNKSGKFSRDRVEVNNNAFFRKGETGDWKNELSVEMAEKIDRITEEKLKGSGFSFG